MKHFLRWSELAVNLSWKLQLKLLSLPVITVEFELILLKISLIWKRRQFVREFQIKITHRTILIYMWRENSSRSMMVNLLEAISEQDQG